MSGGSEAVLTHGEAQLYDRQLRLWGVDAQRRLKTSRVIVLGVSALTGEVAKNLILAGVNRVTLLDAETVSESDVACSFFVSEHDIGKNRAASYCANLRVLNSLVTVDHFSWAPSQSGDVFSMADLFEKHPEAAPCLKEGDFVLVTGYNLATSAAIALECRRAGAACYVAGVSGALGCFFADLGESFKFCQSDDAQLSNFQRSNVGSEQTVSFPPLNVVLSLNPSLKRTDVVATDYPTGQRYFSLACQLLNSIASKSDISSSIDKSLLELCGDNFEVLADATLTPATCSVVGGILAQELVKAICRNAAPFNNFFFIDVTRFYSVVDCVRQASPAPVSEQPSGNSQTSSIPIIV